MGNCTFKDAFGKPREGIRSIRVLDIAAIDLVLTIIAAYVISKYIYDGKHTVKIFIILILLSIVLHKLFCVKTTINNIIFNEKL